MKPFVIPLAGLLAAGAFVVADLYPVLRVVEASLVLDLSKTNWGGGDRLWLGAGLMTVATLLWALGAHRWSTFLSGAALGLLLDLTCSALQWRTDQLSRLKAIGWGDFQPTIVWKPGSYALLAASVLVLLFFVRSGFPSRPPSLRSRSPAATRVLVAELAK